MTDLKENSGKSNQVAPPLSSNFFTIMLVFSAGIGGILYGYDIGVISGALLFIHKTITLSRHQTGLIVGAVLGGGLIGTLLTGYGADRFGRRRMIMIACLVFLVGISSIQIAHQFNTLMIARLLLGIGVGVVAVAVPLYLTELAPANLRGRGVALFQLFLTFGILLAYLVDLGFTKTGNWRGMFAVLYIPTLILLVSMYFLPETPRWLIAQGQENKAKKILAKTRSLIETQKECDLIKKSLAHMDNSWRELFSTKWALALFISLAVAFLNQMTGINIFFQYAPLIMSQLGIKSALSSMQVTVGMGAINFIGTIIALGLVDKMGRRFLLIMGTFGIVLSQLGLALITYNQLLAVTPKAIIISLILLYIASFAIGPGVVVWLAISELLPTKIRGRGVALCLFVNSLVAALLSTVFLDLLKVITISGTSILFAGCSFLYLLIGLFLLPETQGQSLEDVQDSFYHETK